MKRVSKRMNWLLACLLTVGIAVNCRAQTLADRVCDRVNHLRAILPLADDFKDQREQVLRALTDVEAAARDGQSYLALYRLQSLWTNIQPSEYARSRAAVTKEGLPGFERAWRRLAPELKTMDAAIDQSMHARLPQAIRGLIEISRTKSRAYYESSRPFGEDTGIRWGLYYMGVANAQLDFALLCLKLDFSSQRSALPFRSLGPELQTLDARVTEVYKQRDSPELVEEFIALSSNMEFANQLEKQGRHDGALIAYLDAVLKLGLLETSAPSPDGAAALGARLDEMVVRHWPSDTDNSVGMIYSTMARRALSHTATVAPPAEDLKKAAVLIDRVLPAYLNAISETSR
jgi:hypothetical protein